MRMIVELRPVAPVVLGASVLALFMELRGSAAPWVPVYDPRMLAGIVGLEIAVREMQGKFKLSQNRSAEDRAGVAARLTASGGDESIALAKLVAGERPFP